MYPLVFDGSPELEDCARVNGCRWRVDAVSSTVGGPEVEDQLLESCEFVGGEFGEGGIACDQRVEYGLFVGDGKGHVVEMAFEY